MNVQRLIEKYKKLEGVWDAEGAELARQIFLEDLKQLDEQKPVKVPQCVAEYIEFKKKNNFHVYGAMRVIEDHYDKKVPDWFYENNIEKFCLAWLNGYEVEKEKRYFVKIKGNIKENMLVYGELLERYFFTKSFSLDDAIYSHTRKELENAKIGWVFDCEGFEIVKGLRLRRWSDGR
ncbi:TPA: DUF1642 domain-containing protein [Streptococcus pneumoniae]